MGMRGGNGMWVRCLGKGGGGGGGALRSVIMIPRCAKSFPQHRIFS